MINLIRKLALAALLLAFTPAFAKTKVLILYSTGGHSTAAKSVEQLLNEHPEEFEVIRKDFAEELTGFSRWFYFGGYDKISRYANWINKIGVGLKWAQSENKPVYLSERFNANFNQPDKILEYVDSVKPDIIISTHFSVAETLGALREKGHFKNIPIAWTHLDVVSNTFFKQIGDQLDMSFLPTEDMMHDWLEVIPAKKMAAVGIPIMPGMLRQSERPRPAHNDGRPTVLLIGGSMGALAYKEIITEISQNYSAAGRGAVNFIAVTGRNADMQAKLEAWSKSGNFPMGAGLRTTGFVDSEAMRVLQAEADLIVSKPGGLTTFELMTSERPVILTQGIGIQESFNARYIDSQNAGLYLPDPKDVGKAALEVLTTPAGIRLVEGQRRVRAGFHLERIVEWARHAHVEQPEKPATTVLQRLGIEPKGQWIKESLQLCAELLSAR